MTFSKYKSTVHFLLAFACVSLISKTSEAFGVPDHKMITEVAIEELQACHLLPPIMSMQDSSGKSAEQIVVKANVSEDNYFINGFKKTFEYSHFYNPIRPLQPERHRSHHADQAVLDYTQELKDLAASGRDLNSKVEILKHAGMIIHMIQDASSAPHVLWINHGFNDGFENKVSIAKSEISALKPPCESISLAGLNSPIEIMKAAGLGTLKQLEEPVQVLMLPEGDTTPQPIVQPWSRTFFSNEGLRTRKVLDFLKEFNLLQPNLSSPTTDDENRAGWDKKYLERGVYGPFSADISSPTIRGDNFGKTSFTAGGAKIKVALSEYTGLRKALIRQSVLNTQRVILWLGAQNAELLP